MLGTNSSISQGTEKVIFRTTVRFLSVLTGIRIAAGDTNNLIVSGFKNRCRLTDVNLNNLRTINQNFQSQIRFSFSNQKFLPKKCAGLNYKFRI
jgi:hypothetical protein